MLSTITCKSCKKDCLVTSWPSFCIQATLVFRPPLYSGHPDFRPPLYSGHPCIQATPDFRPPLYSGHPCIRATPDFRPPLYSGHPCIRATPDFRPPVYSGYPCIYQITLATPLCSGHCIYQATPVHTLVFRPLRQVLRTLCTDSVLAVIT